MIEITKENLSKAEIPDKYGFFVLLGKDKILYFSQTANLQSTIRKLLTKDLDNPEILKLNSLTSKIHYETTSDLMQAQAHKKIFAQKHSKEISLNIHQNYIYLAIDFKTPFLQVTEDTQKKFFYLGPFEDRFFLYDFLDMMQNAFHLPNCEDEEFPCSLWNEKKCDGWCLKENREISEMIFQNYILSNPQLMTKLEKKYNNLFNRLEFEKAEKIKEQRYLLEKFQEWQKFLLVTKVLEYEDEHYKIAKGRLKKVKRPQTVIFSPIEIDYRKNEIMAFDKKELAERWIVFQYCQKKDKKLVEKVHKKRIDFIQNNLWKK